ncbi:hypothetical protein [Martelella radicis]|uniref:Uncharacterized protein n=1 Tax=Martelella radicis TaxID=1397476 RepID=A0A7W6PC07_9HYPH|nr:hypothetical protein [Martelella radicis]MBB4122952.1 hypothetical protein [Martelella radicis]
MNIYSSEDRQKLMLTCCYSAAARHFSHIALRDIIEPPHDMLDAALARQCALTMMRDYFDVPARRIAKLTDRSNGRIRLTMWKVGLRRECPVFDRAYHKMGLRALALYGHAFEQAREAA